MKRAGRIGLCLACAMAFSVIAQADDVVKTNKFFVLHKLHPVPLPGMPSVPQSKEATASTVQPAMPVNSSEPNTPYSSIAARNVFGLNPPTPPQIPDPNSANPPPKITLTGITTIFGPREALYKVAGYSRPGQTPVPDQSYILQEGQSQDDVTVERIDVEKGVVTFNNHDVPQDIPLATGVASGGAPSSGGPSPRGGFAGRPGFNNFPANIRQGLQQRFGNGNPGSYGGAPNNNPNGYNGYNSGSSYNATPQSYNTGVNGGYVNGVYTFGNQSDQSTTPQLSPDDSAALIAAQKAQLQNEGNPQAALFPSTPYDDQANQEAAGSSGSSLAPPTPISNRFSHH